MESCRGNQTLTDQSIVFQGSAQLILGILPFLDQCRLRRFKPLEYSSNTYMVQTALGLMGQTYQPNMFVGTSNLESAMGKLRSTFAEYGLGVCDWD